MRDLLLGFVVIVCAPLTLLLFLLALVESYQCSAYQEATGKQTKFVGLECYVLDGRQWYSWTEYKNRLLARGSM